MLKNRTILVVPALAVILTACTDVSAETTSTTEPSSTTITVATTTTSTPITTSTTTSTTITTTLPPAPECVDSFYWRGENPEVGDYGELKGSPAQIGPITEPTVDEQEGVVWVGVAVCLKEVVETDTVFLGETVHAVHLILYFGDNPTTGDEILGDLTLGPDDWNVQVPVIKGFITPFDPSALSEEKPNTWGVLTASEFASGLEVGRLYPIVLEIENLVSAPLDCSGASSPQSEQRCEVVNAQLRVNQIQYNADLYRRMLGQEPQSSEEFGYLFVMYLVPIWSG